MLFDVGNRASFEHVLDWYAEVCEHVRPHSVLFILVGHKSDREDDGERVVSRQEAEKLAAKIGAPYIEASSKTNHNIQMCFKLLTERIYRGLQTGEVKLRQGWDGIKSSAPLPQNLQNSEMIKEKKSCC